MNPKHLFADSRFSGFCVYCGGPPETRDHVPSKVLLDEPFPAGLGVVECCADCNSQFSLHEEYVACFLSCVICGSTAPESQGRSKIARILRDAPALAKRIQSSLTSSDREDLVWLPELERFECVIIKLARGHMAYELSLPQIDPPRAVYMVPLVLMSEENKDSFFSEQSTIHWPEIGSRAFIRACKGEDSGTDCWRVVQPGNYQYLVSQADGNFVRLLINDYLACEVCWE